MKFVRRAWFVIRRNPVINAFMVAVLIQFLQDLRANAIDWPHFAGYASALLLGVMARTFTVPKAEVDKGDLND